MQSMLSFLGKPDDQQLIPKGAFPTDPVLGLWVCVQIGKKARMVKR